MSADRLCVKIVQKRFTLNESAPTSCQNGSTKYFVGGLELKPDCGNRYKMWEEYIPSPVSEIDQYLWMVGGSAGALALTGVAAASAFYLSTRPKPEKPLVTLHEQSLLEPSLLQGNRKL
ncbi:hypothetical protein MSG28_013165 [Choristoneura fumiferana]|uniref:Uncharacterized protein n=1 Tax=Choristoneura fumiferana TaxID=7141 RepID=A0ACC0KT49_CHOFU|nr:hypothetical protein MSG28_013165 [Choristoneura fumiferana]